MSVKIEDLQPDVQVKVKAALSEMDSKGIKYSVQYTFRTLNEQEALYSQGRKSLIEVNAIRKQANMQPISDSDNSYTVTNCDGVDNQSAHQTGRAIDIVPIINGVPSWPSAGHGYWQPIANVMKSHGFTWGGDWTKFPDLPHYQID
jgi:peptidoglycan L-alanyl-D-glutamate endopeptidase CwlK